MKKTTHNESQADNQNELATLRTELSKIRTDLAFSNSRLAVDQTHLSYLRTIVSLIGTSATIYKALPLLGISLAFTHMLTAFFTLSAVYFIYKDATTYPLMKRKLAQMQEQADKLVKDTAGLADETDL